MRDPNKRAIQEKDISSIDGPTRQPFTNRSFNHKTPSPNYIEFWRANAAPYLTSTWSNKDSLTTTNIQFQAYLCYVNTMAVVLEKDHRCLFQDGIDQIMLQKILSVAIYADCFL
ncbi:hypothetical protein Csa_010220 [Cucumis sativus]|uniref:Uncharacterized protein n=1 Tax=Cucumis sativus TaxID=3659 RepID=A0A0A0L1A2_CUCSA|nr:hypothetical protein Csa_010220 [Cucumis sativus]